MLKIEKVNIENFCQHKSRGLDLKSGLIGVFGSNGVGKAQPLSSEILTPTGFVQMGHLNVGDKVIGANGEATRIIAIHSACFLPVFQLVTKSFQITKCTDEHLWRVRRADENFQVLSTEALMREMKDNPDVKWYLPSVEPVQTENKMSGGVDPWLVGLIAGCGTTGQDAIVLMGLKNVSLEAIQCVLPGSDKVTESQHGIEKVYTILGTDTIRALGLYTQRHPCVRLLQGQLWRSLPDRMRMLDGIIDATGERKSDGCIEVITQNGGLVRWVNHLVRSLGGYARVSRPGGRRDGEMPLAYPLDMQYCIEIDMSHPQDNEIACIFPVGHDVCQCITVEAHDGLYVTDDFIVTHNSNLANAICFAFTGETRRHSKGAAGCVRQNQPGSASVEVSGEVGEKPFRIVRDISPKGTIKHSLWVGEDKNRTFTKARDIESWLMEMSGISPQLMSEFLFIGQQDFYGFLEANNTELSKKFTTLCGTQGYAYKREFYSDVLKRDIERTRVTGTVTREFLESAIKDAEANLTVIKRSLAQMKKDVKTISEKSPDEIREQVNKAYQQLCSLEQAEKDVQAYRDNLARLEKVQVDQKASLEELQSEHKRLSDTLTAARTDLIDFRSQRIALLDGSSYGEVKQYLTDLNRRLIAYDEKVSSRKRLCNKLNTLPEVEQPDESFRLDAENRLDKVNEEFSEKSGRKRSLDRLLKVMSQIEGDGDDDDSCPLCGADKEHWSLDLHALKDAVEDLDDQISCLRLRSTDIRRSLDTWERNNREYGEYAALLDEIKSQIGQIDVDLSTYTDEELNQNPAEELSILDEACNKVQQAENAVQLQESKLSNIGQQIVKCEQQCRQTLSQIKSLKNDAKKLNLDDSDRDEQFTQKCDEYEKLKELEQRVREGWSDIKGLQGSLETAISQKTELVERLEQMERSEKGEKVAEQWFEKCQMAVDWFKKDGIPRLIHRSILDQLVSVINYELSFFSSPFTVEVNEDLTFTATFPNGTRTVSKDLSGGEKVMLALSFWSAVNRTFAQNLGIMILDEPTDGLDTENKQRLYMILSEWGKALRLRNQQVIIITHDTEMKDVFDQVIVLEKEEELEFEYAK